MKIRNGFVSNSSSSSFIVLAKEELTKEKLLELFKVPEDSPIISIVEDIAKTMMSGIKEVSPEEFINDYGLEDGEDYEPYSSLLKKAKEKNMKIYDGCFSSEGEGAEMMLCYASINIETDDLIMHGEGGY